MPAEQLVLLALGLAFIAVVAITVAYATSHSMRRGSASEADDQQVMRARDLGRAPGNPDAPAGAARTSTMFVSPASTRQVARVVAFLFLASVAVVVALTRAWPETEPAIFTLLAAGTLLVVLSMDMIPPAALGRWRRPAEGIGAIVFLGLLMALTGGVGSPFIVGFFLVVAGTALSLEGLAPLLIAIGAAATIAVVGLVASFDAALEAQGLAWIGFSAVSLILLADIAAAAARAQRQARDEALRASRFDALTGLYNRAFFYTTMEQEIRRSDRMGRGFTMLMLDLDDLKPVNDTFGHQWGDRMLKAIADVVRETIRFTDSAARYGGDEFVVLLPETDATGGFVVGEKLRRDIAALTLHAADRNVRSSISLGLVSYPDDGTTIEQLIAAADVAMYEAKRRGKNRIVGYQTRTERVATAIDLDSAELVQLGPASDVRTGGDPAPWGAASGSGPGTSYGVRPPGDARLQPPSRRRTDEPDHVIEVERSQPPVTGSGATTKPSPWVEPEGASAPRAPSGQPSPSSGLDAGDGSQSDSGRSSSGPAGGGGTSGGSGTHSPWLTRTDAPRRPMPGDDSRPSDAPPQRPAASALGPDDAFPGRAPSRSDEIRRTGERPWIALPIEPYDPPDRPKGRGSRPSG